MTSDFKIKFYLRRNYTNKKGESAIMVRAYKDNDRISLGTSGIYVNPLYFSNGELQKETPNYTSIQTELDKVKMRIYLCTQRLDEDFTLEELREELKSKGSKQKNASNPAYSFNSLAETFLKDYNNMINAGKRTVKTFKNYRSVISCFKSYITRELHREDISTQEVTKDLFLSFEEHLQKRNLKKGTIKTYIDLLKSIFFYAVEKELIKALPFKPFSTPKAQTERVFLNEEELKRFMQLTPKKRYQLAQDLFIFSCFTGIAYSDLMNLTLLNVTQYDNDTWIMIRRQKTKTPATIMVLPPARKILDKYIDYTKKQSDKIFPHIDIKKYNAHLKKLSQLAYISKHLTTHVARHTCATYLLTKQVSIESISKILGHTNIQTTQIYAKILPQKIKTELQSLKSELVKL